MKTALLVVDIQQALVDAHPAHEDTFLLNADLLIHAAHDAGKEVIYVRHDGGPESELEAGTPGWQLNRSISPEEGERIFDKRYSSAFRDTDLENYLHSCGIERLVICGMQTEYCIDTTIKAAFEHHFAVIVPSGATTTYANPFLSGEKLVSYYEHMIWHEPLALVLPMDRSLSLLRE